MSQPELLPIFLKLAERPVLVVGGGVVAASKVSALVPTGARITVVAPSVAGSIRAAGVTVHERPFEERDLDGQWLVVSAATPDVNREVAEAAGRRQMFVNAVDDPANATAYLGGVLRRDGVTVAISTDGRAPALAGLLREGIDALLPLDLKEWFTRADELKREWRSTGVPMDSRRPQLLDALIKLREEKKPRPERSEPTGFVSLVGAGPGAPDLLTLRAVERLRAADVVFYDGLVPQEVVKLASAAQHVSVARRSGPKTLTQDEVIDKLIAAAVGGARVVRLKAGDPFVLGRGGEEAQALVQAGVPFEIVPGLTSAIAAPALAGVPLTHRGLASGFVVVSGHAPAAYAPLLGSIAPGSATVVALMGMAERGGIAGCLVEAGWDPATPAAIIRNASQPAQQVWIGTLAALGADGEAEDQDDPGVIVIGRVVSLATASDVIRSFGLGETSWQPSTIQRL